jgi:hypothetical protein
LKEECRLRVYEDRVLRKIYVGIRVTRLTGGVEKTT